MVMQIRKPENKVKKKAKKVLYLGSNKKKKEKNKKKIEARFAERK